MTLRFKPNPDPNSVTPKQKRVLDLITRMYNRNGFCPTMEEMAAELKVSKVTIWEHVTVLRQKGLLSHGGRWIRGTRPLDTPATRLAKLVKLKYADDAEAAELAEKVLTV